MIMYLLQLSMDIAEINYSDLLLQNIKERTVVQGAPTVHLRTDNVT